MFVGSYTPKLDEKNRLFLPAKFREQLAEGLVVTKGQDFCLTVFPRADFAAMTGRIQEAPLTVRQAREYGRFLAMRAAEDKPDKQGRITIPPLLKEYAGLAREVVVIGALNRVEIWDPTLQGDSIVGHPTERAIARLVMPLAQVETIAIRKKSVGRTLLIGFGIIGAITVYALLQELNQGY